jgi:hypothetical protein
MLHRRVVGDVNIFRGDGFDRRGPIPRRSGRPSKCIGEQDKEEQDIYKCTQKPKPSTTRYLSIGPKALIGGGTSMRT